MLNIYFIFVEPFLNITENHRISLCSSQNWEFYQKFLKFNVDSKITAFTREYKVFLENLDTLAILILSENYKWFEFQEFW